MAPNKKKKKPVSNPARGFATVSTVSKVKAQNVEEESENSKSKERDHDFEPSARSVENSSQKENVEVERDLQELSPEELEKQLEESNLQIFIDTHGARISRDVSRQVSRLKTERRLLRNQAGFLNARQWLHAETIQLIVDTLDAQEDSSHRPPNVLDSEEAIKHVSEDESLARLWSLRQLLPQLGYSIEATNLALLHLLETRFNSQTKESSSSKDSIWGLDECLRWLSLALPGNALPDFQANDVHTAFSRGKTSKGRKIDTQRGISTDLITPIASESTSPSIEASHPNDHASDESTPPSSQSESESDLEPEQLVEKYLTLQARLYEISPSTTKKSLKYHTQQPADIDMMNKPSSNHAIRRISAKLQTIGSDVLFDEDEANRRWVDMRNNLAEKSVERRRLGFIDIPEDKRKTSMKPLVDEPTTPDSLGETDEADDMLGALFASLPETTPGSNNLSATDASGKTVEIRDFGKWTGMSPRRVLEETVRSRDSSARITYKLISSSSFSKRHSLEVLWSYNQAQMVDLAMDSLIFESNPQSIKIDMDAIACPEAHQSEAYVSTIAIFLIFSCSTKEEKAYLRLPAIWRDLWSELSKLKKEQDDEKARLTLQEIRHMIDKCDASSDPPSNADTVPVNENFRGATPVTKSPEVINGSSASADDLKAMWLAKEKATSYQKMLLSRKNLPIWNFKYDLLLAIESHQVVIVCGETGCGKSTQVPAYILEQELSNGRSCKVYCTEPRRISAISLARRVSEELGERKGDIGTLRSIVGYAIRLESQITDRTRLVYATTGIVMRMLEGSNGLGDITHLILDEVHERSIDSDFLLIVLRKLLLKRPELKVVLMSATVDAQRFSDYLNKAPIMNVPGRTFPVKTKYLEDAIEVTSFKTTLNDSPHDENDDDGDDDDPSTSSNKTSMSAESIQHYSAATRNVLLKFNEYRINYNLILQLLVTLATTESYAFYSKAILVFLPGIAEIRRLNDMLNSHKTFGKGWLVHALHSTIATEEQERAFMVPPSGTRKIVLATNIAETGITIPDVTCVIDTGKHKEMRFDERRQLSRLIEVFISRANAKQRRGRAGRVQKGLCFHLFTKDRHDNIMPEEQTPEMLRLSLQDLVLRVKICNLGGIEETLSEALDPPSSKNVRRAVDALTDVKALTSAQDLTALGRQLARLPLDVFLGKLTLLGSIFGCLDAMLTVAAILSSKSPFSAPMGARSQMDTVRLAFRKGDSDLLTVYNAYCAWRRICNTNAMPEYQFCRKNFLSAQTLSNIEDLKAQLTTSLVDAGFIKLSNEEKASLNRVRFYSRKRNFVEIPGRYNANNDSDLILNSVIAWSFYPKLLRREGKGWRNIANNQAVSLHPTSVNKGADSLSQWLSFYHIMQSSNKFYNAHETTAVEDFAVALVCGEADFKMYSGVVVIDGNRIRYSFNDWRTLVAFRALRMQIRQLMSQSFRNPGRSISPQQQEWMSIWQQMFSPEEAKT